MISPERKEFNKAVKELDELYFDFNTKLEAAVVAVLNTQPRKRITFSAHRPKLVQDISNGKITLATISAIWLEEDTIMVKMAWKDEGVSFNEPVSLWSANFCDLYHTYTALTEAIKKTLKDKENPQQEATEPVRTEQQDVTKEDNPPAQPELPEQQKPTEVIKAEQPTNKTKSGGFFSKLFGN